MKELIKDLGLNISELCYYLDITRPTLYNAIKFYDTGQPEKIFNKNCRKLFAFIHETPNIIKDDVMQFVINNINERTSFTPLKEELITIVKKMNTEDAKEILKMIKEYYMYKEQ